MTVIANTTKKLATRIISNCFLVEIDSRHSSLNNLACIEDSISSFIADMYYFIRFSVKKSFCSEAILKNKRLKYKKNGKKLSEII